MSDVDRLRKAADELDDGGVHGQREWPEDDLCICGLDWSAQHRRDVAAAALLRALADERKSGMVVGDWDSGWKVVMKPLWVAALALADTTLPIPHCCADWECGFVTPPDRDHCKCWEKPFTLGAPCQRQGRKRDGTLSEVGET